MRANQTRKVFLGLQRPWDHHGDKVTHDAIVPASLATIPRVRDGRSAHSEG